MKRCYAVNSGVIRNTHLVYTQTGLFFIYKNFNLIKKKKSGLIVNKVSITLLMLDSFLSDLNS